MVSFESHFFEVSVTRSTVCHAEIFPTCTLQTKQFVSLATNNYDRTATIGINFASECSLKVVDGWREEVRGSESFALWGRIWADM